MPVMDMEQLQDAVDRYGAALDRWPAELRQDAASLLANSAEARALLEASVKLDKQLRSPAKVNAPAGLADRIVAAALEKRPAKKRPRTNKSGR